MRRGAVSIEISIDSDVPELPADPHQLRQLFQPPGQCVRGADGEGRVEIRVTLIPGEDEPVGTVEPQLPRVVEVHNGPIGSDDLERIFSPFFTTKPQGTGLGLSIVRKVVHAHDGRIDAVSAPGRGVTFRVALPVVPGRSVRETNNGPDSRR
jgi:nitrogen-specific signal transduction histidine kinase